jgi:gas vesicle protein
MLPSNRDNEPFDRMARMEKELASLVTAMGEVYQVMTEIQVETKKEREINHQELRTWAQSNNSLLVMISSAVTAIDRLKDKISQLPISSTSTPHYNPNSEQILANFAKDLEQITQSLSQIKSQIQPQETLQDLIFDLPQPVAKKTSDDKFSRFVRVIFGILTLAGIGFTIAKINPIGDRVGWSLQKLEGIENKLGLKKEELRLSVGSDDKKRRKKK